MLSTDASAVMEASIGIRVVRGPDWSWGNQDGGDGYVGTLIDLKMNPPSAGKSAGHTVVVAWDNGVTSNYRVGYDDKYDLRAFDSGPSGVKHEGVTCDGCRCQPLYGIRWKCAKCYDFDLCSKCYMSDKHSVDHEFLRVDKDTSPRVRLQCRSESKKVMAKGVFEKAVVVRGRDWMWKTQDGGPNKNGTVLEVKGWEGETDRSVVEVSWIMNGTTNIYRLGHKGKVDLKFITPAEGGYYYPDHLPVLGAAVVAKAQATPAPPQGQSLLASGDNVRVQLDVDVFRAMQEGHGGWNESMGEIIGSVGTVHSIMDSGDVRVRFSGRTWTVNPAALDKVASFKVNDVVRVVNDISQVHSLQDGHGGWSDDMALSLGQLGKVVKVFGSGDLRVSVNGASWTFNPLCLIPAPGETPPDVPVQEKTEDLSMYLKLLSFLDTSALIVAAAAANDASTVRDFLSRKPQEVDFKVENRTAIHVACANGSADVLKVLLEYKASTEIPDEEGDYPLHLCAYSDEPRCADLLVQNGADINSRNSKGATPVMIAATKGCRDILRILTRQPSVRLAEQDTDGDTALHCAILSHHHEAAQILLDARADPALVNFNLFNCVHVAAKTGVFAVMEKFVKDYPQLINLPKDDGFTALHLAAINDNLDIVVLLASTPACDINALTDRGQTALIVAVHQGYSRIVEKLIGYGADLNISDSDGDTALHLAVVRETIASITMDTPEIDKIHQRFELPGDKTANVAMAALLAQEGADLHKRNSRGLTPLELCTDNVATLITKFASTGMRSHFHGSLRRPSQTATSPHHESSTFSTLPAHNYLTQQSSGSTIDGNPSLISRDPSTSSDKVGFTSLPVGAGSAAPKLLQSDCVPAPQLQSLEAVCILCDQPADVQLIPCNHIVLCAEHAKSSKKCPECREIFTSAIKVVKTCHMCQEDPVSVTMKPCGHRFCAACGKRMKMCFTCKTEIKAKEGLSEEDLEDDQRLCKICIERQLQVVFDSCGHMSCAPCARKMKECPFCRTFISRLITIYN